MFRNFGEEKRNSKSRKLQLCQHLGYENMGEQGSTWDHPPRTIHQDCHPPPCNPWPLQLLFPQPPDLKRERSREDILIQHSSLLHNSLHNLFLFQSRERKEQRLTYHQVWRGNIWWYWASIIHTANLIGSSVTTLDSSHILSWHHWSPEVLLGKLNRAPRWAAIVYCYILFNCVDASLLIKLVMSMFAHCTGPHSGGNLLSLFPFQCRGGYLPPEEIRKKERELYKAY